jgi:hypothetical protein
MKKPRTYKVLVHKLALGRKQFDASYVIDARYISDLKRPVMYRAATLTLDPVKKPKARRTA